MAISSTRHLKWSIQKEHYMFLADRTCRIEGAKSDGGDRRFPEKIHRQNVALNLISGTQPNVCLAGVNNTPV